MMCVCATRYIGLELACLQHLAVVVESPYNKDSSLNVPRKPCFC